MPTAFRFSFFEDKDSARQGLDLAALGEPTDKQDVLAAIAGR